MDIWSWVYAEIDRLLEEDRRLAWMIHKLPSWVTDNEYERVDSAMPELLAGVRRLKRPWLEVFVRHWHLQSIVLDRHDISGGMGQAVELLERAHQDDAKDCPQTVCVSQDVCSAYGIVDGPGFAEERMQVSEETLDRIDPSWPCWSCINRERISALLDQERWEEALEASASTQAAMKEAQQEFTEGEFALQEVDAYIGLERYQDAYDCIVDAERPGGGKRYERHKAVQVARCLAALGRGEEALAKLPPWEEVEPYTFIYDDYARTYVSLLRAEQVSWDLELHQRFLRMIRRQAELGAVRDAVDLGHRAAWAAGGAGHPQLALATLRLIDPLLPRLRKPLGAPERHAALQARAASEVEVPIPDDPDALDALFQEGVSFEQGVRVLERFPERRDNVLGVAQHWRRCGHPEEARRVLEAAQAQHAGDPDCFFALAELLKDEGALEALDALLARYAEHEDSALRQHHAWFASHLAEARGDKEGALAALEAMLVSQGADATNGAVLLRLARGAHEAGQLEDAMKAYELLVARLEPPSDAHWELLVVATRLGLWDRVRVVAAQLGMQIEGDSGPIAEDWGLIKVAYPAEGPKALRWARRTGPVTATVLAISGPGAVEHFEDQLVFDPSPLNPDDAEGPKHFAHVSTLKEGGYTSYALDGLDPGEAWVSGLQSAVGGLKGVLRVVSGEGYTLTDPETKQARPGFYAFVAWPTRNPPAILNMIVQQHASRLDTPLIWPALARAIGDEALQAEQAELAERWGM
ncbi:MAG: hypothetical protein H6741_08350 [Alphaproteobacteria bacterium]|nr:hypothetical protein [Alphaproteobacteria bacterium]MCB9792727.1 hypothetical protein [Alphaproteobacteria bacterium]